MTITTTFQVPLLTAAAISIFLAIYCWRRRPAPGAAVFTFFLVAAAEWSVGYSLELQATALSTKVFWAKVEYLGIVALPVMWLVFILQYTHHDRWVTKPNILLLTIIPLITLMLVWTNDGHHLIWREPAIPNNESIVVLLSPQYGLWFWVHTIYSYLLLLLGALLLLQLLLQSPFPYRGQAGGLLVAAAFPWLGNLLFVLDLGPIPDLDLTPFAFVAGGLVTTWTLFRFRLLDIVPVARHSVVENMEDAVFVLDQEDRIVDVNLAAQRLIHHHTWSAIGRPMSEALAMWPQTDRQIQAENNVHLEVAIDEDASDDDRQHQKRYYDLRISPLKYNQGRSTGRMVIMREITERKQAEEALRESEERYRSVISAMAEGVILQNAEGTIYALNTSAREILDLSSGQLVGDSSLNSQWPTIHEDGSPFPGETHPAMVTLRTGTPQTNVVMGIQKEEDTLTWISVNTQPLFRPDASNPHGVVVSFRDITELKQKESELRQAKEMAEATSQELAQANERLQEMDRLKSKFIADVSHELRTPITNLNMHLYLLRHGPAQKREHYLNVLQQETDRFQQLIEGVLDFSLLEREASANPLRAIDLNEVVEETMAAYREQACENGLALIFESAPDLPPVWGDYDKLARAIANLLSNAIAYTPKGRVVVTTCLAQERGQVCLQVEDTGIGITAEDLPHIFRRFYRGTGVSESQKAGTGLGLSVAMRIVELHRGEIEVESRLGQGSTFRIYLPLASP